MGVPVGSTVHYKEYDRCLVAHVISPVIVGGVHAIDNAGKETFVSWKRYHKMRDKPDVVMDTSTGKPREYSVDSGKAHLIVYGYPPRDGFFSKRLDAKEGSGNGEWHSVDSCSDVPTVGNVKEGGN